MIIPYDKLKPGPTVNKNIVSSTAQWDLAHVQVKNGETISQKKINNQKLAINGWLNKQQIIEHLKNLRFKIQGFQFEGLGETIRMKRMIR